MCCTRQVGLEYRRRRKYASTRLTSENIVRLRALRTSAHTKLAKIVANFGHSSAAQGRVGVQARQKGSSREQRLEQRVIRQKLARTYENLIYPLRLELTAVRHDLSVEPNTCPNHATRSPFDSQLVPGRETPDTCDMCAAAAA